jgi:hypothetical protein
MDVQNVGNALLVSTIDCVIFHPLDTMKTRLQTNKISIVKLYSGVKPAMISTIPRISTRLVCYDELKERSDNPFLAGMYTGLIESLFNIPSFYKNNAQINNTKYKYINLIKSMPIGCSKQAVSSSVFFGVRDQYDSLILASFISTLISYPLDTIKVNIQTSNFKCMYSISSLYGGFGIRLLRGVLGKIFVSQSFDFLKII